MVRKPLPRSLRYRRRPLVVPPTPSCCDQAYRCRGEVECAVHGGFDVCCSRPDLHTPLDTKKPGAPME